MQVYEKSNNSRREKVLSLELDESVHSASNEIDGIHGLLLKLLKPEILALKLPKLFEVLVQFIVVGMQYGGLEGQCAAPDSEDADREQSLQDKHLFFG
jgi:hypothetical protein